MAIKLVSTPTVDHASLVQGEWSTAQTTVVIRRQHPLLARSAVGLVDRSDLPAEIDQAAALSKLRGVIAESPWLALQSTNVAFQVVVNEKNEYEIWDGAGSPLPNMWPVPVNNADAPILIVKHLEHVARYDAVKDSDDGGDYTAHDNIDLTQIEWQAVAIGNSALAIVNNYTELALSAVDEGERLRLLELNWLAENVRDYVLRLSAAASHRGDTGSANPYQGLRPYTLADAEAFYGRDRAIDDLLRTMNAGRLTVLHSEPGAGKSSLLQAGIAPRLLAARHLPVIVRPYDLSLSLEIKRTLLLSLEQTPQLAAAPLLEFLRQVTTIIGQATTLYLLLDQFEEFFTLARDEDQRRGFVKDLADCLDDAALNVRWVLCLRSEFLAHLDFLRPQERNPFQNDYRLNLLTSDEAREVITKPVTRHGVPYEEELVVRLLQDLRQADGHFAPVQIQLVCRTLYEGYLEGKAKEPSLPPRLSLALYRQEGEAQGVLDNRLNHVLRQALPTPVTRDLARRLLLSLIASDQRRLRRTQNDLVQQFAIGSAGVKMLMEVLDTLVEQALVIVLHSVENGVAAYELAHDYLVPEIQVSPDNLDQLFVPLSYTVRLTAPETRQQDTEQKVTALQAEVAKGRWANDARIARLIVEVVDLVPDTASLIVDIFDAPLGSRTVGEESEVELNRLRRKIKPKSTTQHLPLQ